MANRRLILLAFLIAAGTGIGFLSLNRAIAPDRQASVPTERPVSVLTVSLENGQAASYKDAIERFAADRSLEVSFVEDGQATLAIREGSAGAPIRQASVALPLPLSGPTLVEERKPQPLSIIARPETLWNGSAELSSQALASDLAAALSAPAGPERWTLTALGDIIPGRWTLKKIQDAGNDFTLPFQKTADLTKASDLTLADLEITLSDRIPHPLEGMSFSTPTKAADGLAFAGIDAVSLSNNHSYNGGTLAFGDMLETLSAHGITYFGAGKNDAEAHAPKILTVKGTKVALLGYSSIVGTVAATATRNGMAGYDAEPWGTLKEAEVQRMADDVAVAKAHADLVFVYFHWGAEYTHQANADQVTVARRLVDSGADLILGTHPHWVQGVEWYKDRLITYSLGNFVFDQEWSTETTQGTILQATFEGSRLVGAELVPYQIYDFNQPRFLSKEKGQAILGDVFAHSTWPSR